MSRKYCAVCGDKHDNPHLGYCDASYEEYHAKTVAQENQKKHKLAMFLALPEEERWKVVFNFMHDQG